MAPLVSLCMIVRNEERNLAACLGSVAGLVQEIVVLDTGSTDRTREVAAQFGARVFDYAWTDDFSAARNACRGHATGQWIFWLDADDRLDDVNHQRLARLFEQLAAEPTAATDGYVMSCYSAPCDVFSLGCYVSHHRLFPNHADLVWTRRIHEHLAPTGGPRKLNTQFADVVLQHVGYRDPAESRQKTLRNLRLLQLDYAVDPTDGLTLFYLGRCHSQLGHATQARRFLQRALDRGYQDRKAYALLADCLAQLQRKAAALETCDAGLARYRDDPELLHLRGRLLLAGGNPAAAETCFLRLLTLPAESYFLCGVGAGLGGEKSRFMLGLVYEQQGRLAEAEEQYLAAVALRPTYSLAWIALGQIYLAQNRRRDVEMVLEHLETCPKGALLVTVLRARVAIVERRFARAQQLLNAAIDADPNFIWSQLVLSDLLFATGHDPQQCIEVHRRILQADPDQHDVRKRLQWLLEQQRQTVLADAAGGSAGFGCSTILVGS